MQFKDLLKSGQANDVEEPVDVLIVRLCVAAVFGAVVAVIRTLSRRDVKPSPGFRTTLVLLTVLAALVTEVIGNNAARAFGLAGALAVVRFRTVVDDTRDSAFVIFAMATGMAVGAGYFFSALIGLPVIGAVAVLARVAAHRFPRATTVYEIVLDVRVKIAGGVEKELPRLLATYVTEYRLTAAGTTKEGDCLDVTYRVRPKPGADLLAAAAALKATPGVEKVQFESK